MNEKEFDLADGLMRREETLKDESTAIWTLVMMNPADCEIYKFAQNRVEERFLIYAAARIFKIHRSAKEEHDPGCPLPEILKQYK